MVEPIQYVVLMRAVLQKTKGMIPWVTKVKTNGAIEKLSKFDW